MKCVLVVVTAAGVLAGAWVALQERNFSGEWVLNTAKSKIATPGIQAGTVRIEHKETAFSFQRTFTTADGPDTSRYDLVIGGSEKVERSGSETRHSRMYWEAGQLVLDEKIEIGGRTATNVVHYSLEDGGRTLVARESFRAPKLQYDNVWVFDRR